MAGLIERLQILVTADASGAIRELRGLGRDADRALGQTENRVDRVGQQLTRFGAAAVAASSVAAVGLYRLGSAASDLNEQTSRTRVVFGQAADVVEEFGRSAAQSAGLSNTAALEAAGSFGTLFRGIGQTEQQAAQSSVTFAKLAGDLASFQNTSPEQAVVALGAALRGESEPIRQYGVLLDDATLKQRALSLGLIDTTTGTLPPAIRAQAAYAEVLAQTGLAQGDFERTSDSAANQQRVLKAEFENLKASIGQGVLPVMQSLLGAANDVFGAFNDLSPETRRAVGSFAAMGTAAAGTVGALSLVAGQLIRLRDRFTALDSTTGVRSLNRLGVATGVVTTAVVAGTLAYRHYSEQKQIAEAHTRAFTDALRQEASGVENAANETIASTLANEDYVRNIDQAGISIEEAAAFIRGEYVPALEDSVDGQINASRILGNLRDQYAAATQRAADHAAALEALGGATDDQSRATRTWSGVLGDASKQLAGVSEKLAENAERQRDANNAVLEGIDSRYAYEQSVDRTQAALEELAAAQNDAATALRDHGAASDENRDAVEALDDATRDASRAIYEEAAASAAAQGAMAGSGEQARIMREYLDGIAQTLAPGDPLRVRLDEYIRALGDIPSDVRTTAMFDDEQARRDARSFGVFLEGVLSTAPNAEFASSPPGRAGGGPVRAGFAYRMGEYNRPEVLEQGGRTYVIPGENGNVTPMRSTGGGGATVVQNNTFNGVTDPAALAALAGREAGWALRTRGAA